jgi:3-deoxy-manno-octulosonate cytidylyltransferase (CMP-KDO synthetase)
MNELESVVIIPARYESERFPGKPLAKILGKPMIQWVFERCCESDADHVVVATDSDEIFQTVSNFGGNVLMTSKHLVNGTQRCQEAVELLSENGDDFDIVINVQGDEPTIDPDLIDQIIDGFQDDEEAEIITAIRHSTNSEDYLNPNVVKATVTLPEEDILDALYFSRSPIPYIKEGQPISFYQHIGIYGFQSEVLEAAVNMEATDLEAHESLEQLRWIQNHFLIQCILTDFESAGVDTPEDISIVENILK